MGALRALRELGASFARADVLVLCYHSVRIRERFAAQMTALAERGYSVLSLQHFMDWLHGVAPLRSPAVLVTFDGGYLDQLENAVPVLQSLGFPATFFPVSYDLEAEGPGMKRSNLLALTAAGHAIGCHTHTHPDLTRLSPEELEYQVIGSKQRLEDALGQRVTAFSYPDGARNPRVASLVRQAGFDAAFTVDLGGVSRADDPYQLKRVSVLGEPKAGEFLAYLSGTRLRSGSLLLCWKMRERLLDRREA